MGKVGTETGKLTQYFVESDGESIHGALQSPQWEHSVTISLCTPSDPFDKMHFGNCESQHAISLTSLYEFEPKHMSVYLHSSGAWSNHKPERLPFSKRVTSQLVYIIVSVRIRGISRHSSTQNWHSIFDGANWKGSDTDWPMMIQNLRPAWVQMIVKPVNLTVCPSSKVRQSLVIKWSKGSKKIGVKEN